MRFALFAIALLACTDDAGSRKALGAMGFTNIQLRGWSPYCGDGDDYATAFTAMNPQGRQVAGVVCCGVVKNCTVRF